MWITTDRNRERMKGIVSEMEADVGPLRRWADTLVSGSPLTESEVTLCKMRVNMLSQLTRELAERLSIEE